MGQAVVVYEDSVTVITIDSDELETMTKEEVEELIREARHTSDTGESDFFGEVTYGKNPKPVYRS